MDLSSWPQNKTTDSFRCLARIWGIYNYRYTRLENTSYYYGGKYIRFGGLKSYRKAPVGNCKYPRPIFTIFLYKTLTSRSSDDAVTVKIRERNIKLGELITFCERPLLRIQRTSDRRRRPQPLRVNWNTEPGGAEENPLTIHTRTQISSLFLKESTKPLLSEQPTLSYHPQSDSKALSLQCTNPIEERSIYFLCAYQSRWWSTNE